MSLDLNKILNDLNKLFVPVEANDATDYKNLQRKLILCNSMQDRVVRQLNRIEPVLGDMENNFRNEKFSIDSRKRDIKANIDKIKRLPTGKERDEAAEAMLESDLERLLSIENDLNSFKVARNALTTTLRKLKGTEGSIKLLKSMLDEQVNKLNIGTMSDPETIELQKSLQELDDLDGELDDEIGIDDDVESSEEYIDGATDDDTDETDEPEDSKRDESVLPNTNSLDMADSTEENEDSDAGLVEPEDPKRDESVLPNTNSLDMADSAEGDEDSDDDMDLVSMFLDDDSDDGSGDSDSDGDPNVTAKHSAQVAENSDPESDTPEETVEHESTDESDDTEFDFSDIDLSSDDEDNNQKESVAVEEAARSSPSSKAKDGAKEGIVEDDASIGSDYDIESLLDM